MDKNPEIILKSRYKNIHLDYSCGSIAQYLLQGAEENVKIDRTLWLTNGYTGESLKFSDVEPYSRKVCYALQKYGFQKGDTVLYLTSDVTRIYTIVLAIWRLGGVAFSSYPNDQNEILAMRIKDAKVKWIICDPIGLEQCSLAVSQVDWKIEIFTFGPKSSLSSDDSFPNVKSVDELFSNPPVEYDVRKLENVLDDPILILCTSGTTGLSKGAIHTNRSMLSLMHFAQLIPYAEKPDLFLLKCIHVLGMSFPMRNIKNGSHAIMLPQFSKQLILETVHKYKPRLVFGLPPYLNYLVSSEPDVLKYDRSSLEYFVTGGIVVHQKFFDDIYKHVPSVKGVINGMGMTECGVITTTVDLDSATYRAVQDVPPLSIGLLYPNSEMKVLNLDTGKTLKTLGPNQRGELVFKTPLSCIGYINRPEETENTFQNGWLKTGDFGYYDKNGFVFIVDRIKETFMYQNNRISPSELEEILLDHPAVLETSVFGVKDSINNFVPRAAVCLKNREKCEPTDLIKFVNERVESFMQLRGGLYILPSPLPRGDTGKISRIKVAALVEDLIKS